MRSLLVFACLLSLPALAAEVFVNGVSVEGLTNQTFEKVNVRLDEKGNVHIDAPGYSVKRVTLASDKEVKPDGTLTQKYFLVTEQSPLGMTEYDIDLFLNGKFLRTLKSSEDQIVTDVTKFLKPGKNQVLLQAKKNLANKEQPKSLSKSHVFRVIIGEATVANDRVTIEKPLVTFTRTAADSNDVVQEYSFTTR